MATRMTREQATQAAATELEAIEAQPTGVVVSLPETNSLDEDAQEVADRFDAALASPESERMTVKIYRVSDATGKLEYAQDLTRHQFDRPDMLETIRRTWGAGEYEFRLIGSKGIIARRRQSVAQPLGPIPEATAAPNSDALAVIVQTIAQGQQRLLEALQSRPDPMADMARMMQMAKLMREAFAPATPAAPASDPLSMVREVMSVIKETRNAVKEIAEEEAAPPTDPLAAIVPQALQALTSLTQSQNANNQPVQPLAPIQIPQPVNVPPPNNMQQPIEHQANPAPQVQETPEQMMIRGCIEDLCDMAARNDPIEKGGEYIADKVPDELLSYMDNRYWFELVAGAYPIVKPHEDWIRKAKAHADTLLRDDGTPDAG